MEEKKKTVKAPSPRFPTGRKFLLGDPHRRQPIPKHILQEFYATIEYYYCLFMNTRLYGHWDEKTDTIEGQIIKHAIDSCNRAIWLIGANDELIRSERITMRELMTILSDVSALHARFEDAQEIKKILGRPDGLMKSALIDAIYHAEHGRKDLNAKQEAGKRSWKNTAKDFSKTERDVRIYEDYIDLRNQRLNKTQAYECISKTEGLGISTIRGIIKTRKG